ncbi:Rne/Rng family ribonuclease [Leeia sp. TBRC 13508]|uniref:Ribonuclease E n=1 Tax=Leeia speluncae TaxID=2884804 RepID=A0ABS8D1R7_9NEIS|nr:Rne/Rng family ribonuclease [Leeia speluncae]MCB6182110.1 Rne/Rng family ribonuclease [Leeia speluncae]
MKRMLFNATQSEELRVAIVDGQKLIDLDIETVGKEQRKSNIYKGVITRIEPSLEAAFVDYGQERHGFLPFKEVARSYFLPGTDHRARIQDALKEGMEVIVQVDKDERGNKGAALTTFISLAGRYLVLMPNNPRGGGVSRRIEGEERNELRALLDQLDSPNGMSVIGRTAAIGRTLEELQWDLNYLLQLWNAIEGAATSQTGAFLIYQESSLVIRAIRDYFQPDIGEILIDTESLYEQARQFMSHVMPANVHRVKLYKDDVPLFSRFQIEHQIETAYRREVSLPSGGAIVIDHTEALVSIDVNSARATRGGDIETTALNTNLEAADEIARQLRLRDLGGLIVIDFIDMENPKNQREVENRLKDALHHDRARVQYGKISRFGLLELSRQRLQPSLGESAHMPCPRCHGTGFIRGTESSALHILRILQEEAMKENTGAVHAQVPVDVATYLLNEKRAEIYAIEARLKVSVVLIPNIHLETPNYKINRLRHDDLNHHEDDMPSYKMMERPSEDVEVPVAQKQKTEVRQQAAVQHFTPDQPAPIVEERKAAQPAKPGFFARIINWLKGETEQIKEQKPAEKSSEAPRRGRNNRNDRNNRNERNNRQDRGERSNDRQRNQNDETRQPRQEENNQRRKEKENRNEAVASDKETATAATTGNTGRNNRNNRNDRGDKNERTERNTERQEKEPRESRQPAESNNRVSTEVVSSAPENAAESEHKSNNRRRRNRRGERKERSSEENTAFVPNDVLVNAESNAAPAVSEVVSAPVEITPAPAPIAEAKVEEAVAAPSVVQVAETVVENNTASQVEVVTPSKEEVKVTETVEAIVSSITTPASESTTAVETNTVVPQEAPAVAPTEVAVPVVETVVADKVPEAPVAAEPAEELHAIETRVTTTEVAEEAPAKPRRQTRRKTTKPEVAAPEQLQLVETAAEKVVDAPVETVVAEVEKPKTTRRRKPKATTEAVESLQQVETQANTPE